MLLEARLDGRLHLLHGTDDALDLLTRAPVEEGDARSVTGRVPGGAHTARVAVGDQPEHERVNGVDLRAESSSEPDPVDLLDAVALHQEPAAGVERRLGELDLPDVVLRDREPGSPAHRT